MRIRGWISPCYAARAALCLQDDPYTPQLFRAGEEHWSSVNGEEGAVVEGKMSESALKPPNSLFQAPRQVFPAFAGNLQRAERPWGILLRETSVPSTTVTPGLLCPVLFIAHPCAGSTLLRAGLLSLEISPWFQPVPPCPSHSPAKQLLPSWTNLRQY